jgi:hypothetical protein
VPLAAAVEELGLLLAVGVAVAVPVGALDEVPVGVLDGVSVGALDEVPVGALDEVPVGALDEVPVGVPESVALGVGEAAPTPGVEYSTTAYDFPLLNWKFEVVMLIETVLPLIVATSWVSAVHASVSPL